MIVIVGFARSGTSIMFKTLEAAGLRVGECHGFLYRTENTHWARFNRLLGWKLNGEYLLGKKICTKEVYKIGGRRAKLIILDILTNVPNVPLPKELHQIIEKGEDFFSFHQIEVLKDPNMCPLLKYWVEHSDYFKNAKYIWMTRDPLQAAKSLVRMKLPRWQFYRKVLTTKKALQIYHYHNNEVAKVMPSVNHIKVKFEDMRDDTNDQRKKIEEFLGFRPMWELIDHKLTWDGGNRDYMTPNDNSIIKPNDVETVIE